VEWQSIGGGRIIAGKLDELRKALDEYYGALTMLKEGMSVRIPEKPDALKLLEKCEAFGIPLVAGGLLNQPHIWLLEVGVIRNERELRERLESLSASGGDNVAVSGQNTAY
jgi:hypothetical protein